VVNVDGKLTPVPWELVTIVAGKAETTDAAEAPHNDFVLTVDQSVLREAPSFASEEFPDTQKMDWDADIQTYWQEYLPAESAYPAP
jgi:hypothetical protein